MKITTPTPPMLDQARGDLLVKRLMGARDWRKYDDHTVRVRYADIEAVMALQKLADRLAMLDAGSEEEPAQRLAELTGWARQLSSKRPPLPEAEPVRVPKSYSCTSGRGDRCTCFACHGG